MAKLILHIGLSKTGTSAIQNFLWFNRNEFYSNYSILYPETGIFGGGGIYAHYKLAWSIYKPEEVNINDIKPIDYLADSLYKEIENYNPKIVILSSEAFMHYKENTYIKKLMDLLKEITSDVSVVVYFRRQDLWVESSYLQVIKTGQIKVTPFKDSVNHAKNFLNWLLKYDEFLSRWKVYANIIPRIYDKKLFPYGNVILDFLSILGIDYPAEKAQIEVNPSLSHISALVLREINERFELPKELHRRVVQYLLEQDKVNKHPLKSFFTLEERLSFLERYRESNERLFREYFNSENRFVLSEEEIEFYREQDEILKDKERLEGDIRERYEMVMEYLRGIEPDFEKFRK